MLYLRYLSTVLAATTTLVASYPVTEKYYEHYFPAGMKTTCDGDHFALTFDDGPYMYTNDLLDKLDEAGIKATFFVNGHNFWDIETMPEAQATIKRAYDAGHQIANHGYTHANWSALDTEGLRLEVQKLDDALLSIIGEKPAFLRPPYGALNDVNFNFLTGLGYTVVRWSVDSKAYESESLDVEEANYKAQLRPSDGEVGGIGLEHDVYEQTVEELIDFTVDFVRSEGYKFITVAECFGTEPYQ